MITGKDRENQERARALLQKSIDTIAKSRTLPDDACPTLESGLLAAAAEMILAAISLLRPTPAEAVMIGILTPGFRAIREMTNDHLVQEHMEEGDLAKLLPDQVPKEWDR